MKVLLLKLFANKVREAARTGGWRRGVTAPVLEEISLVGFRDVCNQPSAGKKMAEGGEFVRSEMRFRLVGRKRLKTAVLLTLEDAPIRALTVRAWRQNALARRLGHYCSLRGLTKDDLPFTAVAPFRI